MPPSICIPKSFSNCFSLQKIRLVHVSYEQKISMKWAIPTAHNSLLSNFGIYFFLFRKHQILLINKMYARCPGIGYVEPYEGTIIVSVNKMYARNRLC